MNESQIQQLIQQNIDIQIQLEDIQLIRNRKGQSLGLCFIKYSAKDINQIRKLLDKKIEVDFRILRISDMTDSNEQKNKLFVSNFSYSANKEHIVNLFQQFGQITECFILTKNGKSKGQAVVKFSAQESAQLALSIDNIQFMERQLRVQYFVQN